MQDAKQTDDQEFLSVQPEVVAQMLDDAGNTINVAPPPPIVIPAPPVQVTAPIAPPVQPPVAVPTVSIPQGPSVHVPSRPAVAVPSLAIPKIERRKPSLALTSSQHIVPAPGQNQATESEDQPAAPAPEPPQPAMQRAGNRLSINPIAHAPMQPVATMVDTAALSEQLVTPATPNNNPLAPKKKNIAPHIVTMKPVTHSRNYLLAFFLSLFLGGIGADRLYLGYPMTGLFKLLLIAAPVVLHFQFKSWPYSGIVSIVCLGLWVLCVLGDIIRIGTRHLRSADNLPLGKHEKKGKYVVATAAVVIAAGAGLSVYGMTSGKAYLIEHGISFAHIRLIVESAKNL